MDISMTFIKVIKNAFTERVKQIVFEPLYYYELQDLKFKDLLSHTYAKIYDKYFVNVGIEYTIHPGVACIECLEDVFDSEAYDILKKYSEDEGVILLREYNNNYNCVFDDNIVAFRSIYFMSLGTKLSRSIIQELFEKNNVLVEYIEDELISEVQYISRVTNSVKKIILEELSYVGNINEKIESSINNSDYIIISATFG